MEILFIADECHFFSFIPNDLNLNSYPLLKMIHKLRKCKWQHIDDKIIITTEQRMSRENFVKLEWLESGCPKWFRN